MDDEPSFTISARWMIEVGSTFRSNAPTWPRVPAGPGRCPSSSTRVRFAPMPRRERVCTPVPPSTTNPPNWWLNWVDPAATLDFCRNSAALTWPIEMLVSAVMTWIGEVVSYSVRRSSEPVTVILSSWTASASVCWSSSAGAAVVSCANAAPVYRHAITAAVSGTRRNLLFRFDI